MNHSKTLSLLAACLALPIISHAQSTWTGAISTDYGNAGNWSPSGVPSVGTNVIINTNTPNGTIIPSGNWDRRGAGTTTISNSGSVTLNLGSARFLNNGTFNVSGGSFTQTGEYFIVASNAQGTFNQSGGTVTSSLSRGFQISDNDISQSGSTYNLSAGTLNVTSLATWTDANLRNVWFGKGGESYTGGNGSAPGDKLIVTGGTATFTKDALQSNTSQVRLSRNAAIQVSAGTVTFANYNNFIVGYQASNTTNSGILVNGGTLVISGGTNINLGQADDGKLTISSGTMNMDGSLILGGTGADGNNDGIGTAVMTGGSFFASGINLLNPSGASTFSFSGGFIRLQGDQSTIINQSWFITSGAPNTVTAIYDNVNNWTDITVVPEPSTCALMGLGLGAWALVRRRASRRA